MEVTSGLGLKAALRSAPQQGAFPSDGPLARSLQRQARTPWLTLCSNPFSLNVKPSLNNERPFGFTPQIDHTLLPCLGVFKQLFYSQGKTERGGHTTA